jgi:hypothetical protein
MVALTFHKMEPDSDVGLPILKIECAVANFFFIKLRDLRFEAEPNTGRVYFIDKKDRIVAVATQRRPP